MAVKHEINVDLNLLSGILSANVVLIAVIFTILLIPIILVLTVYRLLVWIFVRIFRPDLKSFVSGMNGMFTSESHSNVFVNIMIGFVIEGELSRCKLSQMFQERIMNDKDSRDQFVYQRLRTTWTHFLGYTFWKKDEDFNLSNHIRNYDYTGDLQLPGVCDENSLQKVWSGLAEAPWKENQSPWEMLVVSDYLPSTAGDSKLLIKLPTDESEMPVTPSEKLFLPGKPKHTLIIFRVDHILCDIYSLIGLFRLLFKSPFKTPKITRNNRILSKWQRLKVLLTLPYEITDAVFLLLKGRKIGGKQQITDCHSCFTPKIPVQLVKSLKKKFGVEFTTVIHSLVHGAVDRALKRAGKDSPRLLDMTSIFPLPEHPGGLCVHMTLILVELPCNTKSSLERLRQTQRVIKSYEQALFPTSINYFFRFLTLFPSTLTRYITRILQVGPSFVMSNFPVTLTKESVDGMDIVDVFTALPLSHSVGMMVSSWGVNNQQRFNFFMDRSIFGHGDTVEEFSTLFLQELAALQEAAG